MNRDTQGSSWLKDTRLPVSRQTLPLIAENLTLFDAGRIVYEAIQRQFWRSAFRGGGCE
jgi:hypothetical protein